MAIEAEAELSEMTDGKADDKAADKESANGVSADKNALGAERDMGGELTAGDRTRSMRRLSTRHMQQCAKLQRTLSFKNHPHAARTTLSRTARTGAEGEDSARRGEAVDSLNSAQLVGRQGGRLDGRLGQPGARPGARQEGRGRRGRRARRDDDDDEVIHRGRGRRSSS